MGHSLCKEIVKKGEIDLYQAPLSSKNQSILIVYDDLHAHRKRNIYQYHRSSNHLIKSNITQNVESHYFI